MIRLLRAYSYSVRLVVVVTCALLVTLLVWLPERIIVYFDDRE